MSREDAGGPLQRGVGSTMDEREMFDAWLKSQDGGASAFECWQAGRRTTPDRECEWKCDDIDNGIWESSCGESWSFIDGGPIENRMLFCHRCGGKLKTAPTSDKGGA